MYFKYLGARSSVLFRNLQERQSNVINIRFAMTRKVKIGKFISPRVIPVKYKVIQRQENDTGFANRAYMKRKAMWSNNEVSHPLTDSPIIEDYPIKLPDGGLRYYGFDYYSRDPDNVETIPREEISKLFMVQRTVPYSGLEWWHKQNFDELGLTKDRAMSYTIVVKNIPEMNEKLYSMKHLIKITPIKLPDNLPLDADPAHCLLTEEGELLYDPGSAVPDEDLEEADVLATKKVGTEIINTEGRKRWYSPWEMET